MIQTKIWVPRTDPYLDSLFEEYRVLQYNDHSHHLHHNYSEQAFTEPCRFSITFDNDIPVIFSSILSRACWPDKAYRIGTRTWKANSYRVKTLTRVTPAFSDMISSQVQYVKANLEYSLIFASRHSNHWQKFTTDSFKLYDNLEFKYNTRRYLTCDNCEDDTCWQRIIYLGDDSYLQNWKSK